jgi:hypothetical protein
VVCFGLFLGYVILYCPLSTNLWVEFKFELLTAVWTLGWIIKTWLGLFLYFRFETGTSSPQVSCKTNGNFFLLTYCTAEGKETSVHDSTWICFYSVTY